MIDIWPATIWIDQLIKNLIRDAFEALDDTSSDVGPRMAREIYTEQASVVLSTGEFKGREGEALETALDMILMSDSNISLQRRCMERDKSKTTCTAESLF